MLFLVLVLVLVFLYLGRGAVSPYLIPSCAFVFISLGEGVFLFPYPFLVRLVSLWHCILENLCVPFCTHLVMGSVGEFTVLIWVGYTWTPFGVLGIYFELDTGIESRISSGAIEAL